MDQIYISSGYIFPLDAKCTIYDTNIWAGRNIDVNSV